MSHDPLDTACEFKWNYPNFNLARGEFRSCCRTPSNRVTEEQLQANGIDAFLNSPEQRRDRLELLQGIRTKSCSSCWDIEDDGGRSYKNTGRKTWQMLREHGHLDQSEHDQPYSPDRLRQRLQRISGTSDPTTLAHAPKLIEISMGNTCDMKCMYCNHHYSSQWGVEEIKLGRITQEQYDREFPKAPPSFSPLFWQWFEQVGAKTFSRLGIIGGEPLIMPEFYTTVERAVDIVKRTQRDERGTIWIVTNMNTPANYLDKFLSFFPTLSETMDVEILVSMESVGTRAEYIRNGINWDRFTANIDRLLSQRDVSFDFGFIPTLNVLSITSLLPFIKFTEDLYSRHGRPVAVKHNLVTYPQVHNPYILTDDFARYIDEVIAYMEPRCATQPHVKDQAGTWEKFIEFIRPISNGLRNNSNDKTAMRSRFADWVDDFDRRRDLDFKTIFPEYGEFYDLCRRM